MILSTSGAIYQAASKTNLLFYNGIINTIVTVCGFLIAVYYGGTIETMAYAWDITLIVNFFTSYYIIHKFALNETSFNFYKSLIPQVINSGLTFLLTNVLIDLAPMANIFMAVVYKVIFVSILTFLFSCIFKQYNLKKVIKLIKCI